MYFPLYHEILLRPWFFLTINRTPKSTQTGLEGACQDAYAKQQIENSQEERFEVLVVAFEFTPQDDQLLKQNSRNNLCLENVKARLESNGAFDQIDTEYIRYQGNLTEIIIELARIRGIDTIYLTHFEGDQAHTKRPGILKRLGVVRSQTTKTIPFPVMPLTTAQLETGRLLKETSCKIVITDSQGVYMRVSYYQPLAKRNLNKVQDYFN